MQRNGKASSPDGNAYTIIKSRVLIPDYGYSESRSPGKGEMTLNIKLVLLLVFLCVGAPRSIFAEEPEPENLVQPETDAVSRSTVEEPPEPVRTVQIPVFKNGKWEGYREEHLETERKPASLTTDVAPEPSANANGPAPDETGKPDSLTPLP